MKRKTELQVLIGIILLPTRRKKLRGCLKMIRKFSLRVPFNKITILDMFLLKSSVGFHVDFSSLSQYEIMSALSQQLRSLPGHP